VTPAASAEPVPGHGQNIGISGASRTVADPAAAEPVPGSQLNGRRLRPIRFAHSGFHGTPPVSDVNAADDYDPTDFNEPPADTEKSPVRRRSAPANEGLSILGGIRTTEVPADDEPTRDLSPPLPVPPPAAPPANLIIPVTSGPSGATWNQQLTPPPQPVGGAGDKQQGSFWMMMGGLLHGPADEDDGQPRKTFRDLPPDVQLRFWRYRLLIMLAVGLVSGIFVGMASRSLAVGLAIGLTLAILAGIIDTVYRARMAPHYDNGATFPGAQRRTRRQLRWMRRSGYLALDARPIPNSREYIDHLVIGPTGVYAIDSERWDRRLPVRAINGKQLYLGPASQKERLSHALWEAGQASQLLSAALGTSVEVRPALAIYGPRIPWDIATIREVDVFTGTALRKYLKRRGRLRAGSRLSREEVRTYFATAARVLPDVAPTKSATPVG